MGELDYSHLDEAGKPTLRIIDRVANMTELYVDGDSVWVEQVHMHCLRNLPSFNLSSILFIKKLFSVLIFTLLGINVLSP